MKALSVLFFALGVLLPGGCATTGQRLSKANAAEFERQLAKSAPVAEHGFSVKMVRFSHDLKKALVVFSHPTRQDWELVLQDDGFRRYSGMTMQPFYTPGTANTPPVWLLCPTSDRRTHPTFAGCVTTTRSLRKAVSVLGRGPG